MRHESLARRAPVKITLLSARGLRAMAYSVVLSRHSRCEVSLVEYGADDTKSRELPARTDPEWEPLPHWLRRDWSMHYRKLKDSERSHQSPESLNSRHVAALLKSTVPDVVLFAGGAGSIVEGDLLSVAPFLHLHPGRLPQFRGSTTIYWSLLMGEPVSVSAIFLCREIDQGSLLGVENLAGPIGGSNIDGLYDAGIRAWAFDKILASSSDLPQAKPQPIGGTDYYVIHPVLKNLVIARLEAKRAGAE